MNITFAPAGTMCEKNNKTEIYKMIPTQTIMIDNLCMQLYFIEQIDINAFPILEKYDKISVNKYHYYSKAIN